MFTYRTRTTQSVRWAGVIIIITHILKVTMHPNRSLLPPCTSFRRNNEIAQAPTSFLLLFSSMKSMNAVRLFHRMSSIYLSRSSSHRSALLTCRHYDTGNQPAASHLSGPDSLVTGFVTGNAASRRGLSAYEILRICKSDDQDEIRALQMK